VLLYAVFTNASEMLSKMGYFPAEIIADTLLHFAEGGGH